MSEVVVHAALARGAATAPLLAAACQATGLTVRLERYGSGSLFQQLRARKSAPPPDLVLWYGPYAAQAAALDGLLQPHQPASLAPRAAHDEQWRWSAAEFSALGTHGAPVASVESLLNAPGLALPDPERSDVGTMFALAILDRARQVEGDVEAGWRWWQMRIQNGVSLQEDESSAARAVSQGRAATAVSMQDGAAPIAGLTPVPHAVALAAEARNVDDARRLFDWLMSADAQPVGTRSAWQAETNGLTALQDAAPRLDVDWATGQYNATRLRWAQSGFGPGPAS